MINQQLYIPQQCTMRAPTVLHLANICCFLHCKYLFTFAHYDGSFSHLVLKTCLTKDHKSMLVSILILPFSPRSIIHLRTGLLLHLRDRSSSSFYLYRQPIDLVSFGMIILILECNLCHSRWRYVWKMGVVFEFSTPFHWTIYPFIDTRFVSYYSFRSV